MPDPIVNPSQKSNTNVDRNELILQSAGEGICCIEMDETISFANPSALEILGWTGSDVLGLPYWTVFFGASENDTQQLDLSPMQFALLDGQSSQVSSESFFRKDGSRVLVEYLCVPLKENEKIVGAVVTFQDINERSDIEAAIAEARDAAIESSRTKMAFLANMSHEIRTPLNGIIGMSELLSKTHLQPDQSHYASVIRSSAEFLLAIVNEILDFSKIEAGKLQLETLAFDLEDVIKGSVEFFRAETRKKGIELRLETIGTLDRFVVGDSNRLRQVLNNLLSNAVKFTENGEISVKLELVQASETGKAAATISVCDSGIGISSANQDSLFQPFIQADASTTRRFGGTGLGLAISKQIINMMGGELAVESELGKGSVFSFNLSFELADRPTNAAESRIPRAGSPDRRNFSTNSGVIFQGKRVLVAEDNKINQQVAVGMLKTFGIEIDLAETGFQAIELSQNRKYDLIFMDCQMPEMDGFQATRQIRTIENGAQRVPIVAMTASVLAIEQEKCIASGMDDFLGKPFSRPDLDEILSKYLKSEIKILDSNTSFVQHCLGGILEKNALASLISIEEGGEPDFVVETLDLYFQQADITLAEVKRSFENEDRENLANKAHLLRGSSGSVGLSRIFQLCANIEDSAEELDWNELRNIYNEMISEYTKSKQTIADFKLRQNLHPREIDL